MTGAPADSALEDIRREMDEIDDAILELLARRFAASQRVKSHKSATGSLAKSPIRPAREAQILRRLLAKGKGMVPPELTVRLWRVILAGSSLMQASITLHLPEELFTDMGRRLMLRDHFGAIEVSSHGDAGQTLSALARSPGDIAVLPTTSDWARPFLEGSAGAAHVMAVLPAPGRQKVPDLLVFGHAEPQASGDDQSLFVAPGELPQKVALPAVWTARAGDCMIAALPGFAVQGAGLAGRFPAPLEFPS